MKTKLSDKLDGLHIVVVGAGPGGLTFAKAAKSYGAKVEVIEQDGDPRGSDAGYTDRSFNLTLNNAGRRSLADDRVLQGGINVFGRAIHNSKNDEVTYASYGEGDPALLTSIPRPLLRQNLVKLAEEEGVIFKFHSKVLEVEPDKGVLVIKPGNKSAQTLKADLIVLADGLYSLGDSLIKGTYSGELNLKDEPYNYVTVVLDKDACTGLSLHHIHFWHQIERDSLSIGVPNSDGTIAVLMVSKFADIGQDESPFPDFQKSTDRIAVDFPQLLTLDQTLPERLIGRKRGRFYYKSITNYVLGERCVIVGDAGSTIPPWAAFGANSALYAADALVRFIVGSQKDMSQALNSYEKHMLVLADLVSGFVSEHGKFLVRDVVSHPNDRSSSPVLGQLINIAVKKSDVPSGVDLLSF